MPEISGVELESLRSQAGLAQDLRRQNAQLRSEVERLKGDAVAFALAVEQLNFHRQHAENMTRLLETVTARLCAASECLARAAERKVNGDQARAEGQHRGGDVQQRAPQAQLGGGGQPDGAVPQPGP